MKEKNNNLIRLNAIKQYKKAMQNAKNIKKEKQLIKSNINHR